LFRLVDQASDVRRIRLVGELEHEQIGLDDVLGRRQHVGDEVLALDDLLVDGAVHLLAIDGPVDHDGEGEEDDEEGCDQ
jgi:hypothetical protein